jgi:hypothetical protein
MIWAMSWRFSSVSVVDGMICGPERTGSSFLGSFEFLLRHARPVGGVLQPFTQGPFW